MKGIITAGGKGERLGLPYNKHQALVYDKLMIEYPVETMRQMGAEPVIVSNPDVNLGNYEHRFQEEPRGMPDAILQAEDVVEGVFPVLAGDVFFDPAPISTGEPTLYWHNFPGAVNHSVWNPETNEIVEKPTRDIGTRAIVAYIFDERVFDVIRSLKPSEREELEMTDIYKWYLTQGIRMEEYKGFFGDMGTPDGLLKVANYVRQKI